MRSVRQRKQLDTHCLLGLQVMDIPLKGFVYSQHLVGVGDLTVLKPELGLLEDNLHGLRAVSAMDKRSPQSLMILRDSVHHTHQTVDVQLSLHTDYGRDVKCTLVCQEMPVEPETRLAKRERDSAYDQV